MQNRVELLHRLDLFKKTVPSFTQTGMGFLQTRSKSSVALRAKSMVMSLAQVAQHSGP